MSDILDKNDFLVCSEVYLYATAGVLKDRKNQVFSRKSRVLVGEFRKELRQGQDVINGSDEPVFFPVVDRFSSNFYENVSKGMLDNIFESPFTIRFGGVDYVLDQIIDIYVAALLYGSIVHQL